MYGRHLKLIIKINTLVDIEGMAFLFYPIE